MKLSPITPQKRFAPSKIHGCRYVVLIILLFVGEGKAIARRWAWFKKRTVGNWMMKRGHRFYDDDTPNIASTVGGKQSQMIKEGQKRKWEKGRNLIFCTRVIGLQT